MYLMYNFMIIFRFDGLYGCIYLILYGGIDRLYLLY